MRVKRIYLDNYTQDARSDDVSVRRGNRIIFLDFFFLWSFLTRVTFEILKNIFLEGVTKRKKTVGGEPRKPRRSRRTEYELTVKYDAGRSERFGTNGKTLTRRVTQVKTM